MHPGSGIEIIDGTTLERLPLCPIAQVWGDRAPALTCVGLADLVRILDLRVAPRGSGAAWRESVVQRVRRAR